MTQKPKPRSSARRDSHLAELFPVDAATREVAGFVMMKRGLIHVQKQIRFDAKDDIDGFRENISEMKKNGLGIDGCGILQPLLVTPSKTHPGEYDLVAGERRYWASEGVTDELPVVILKTDASAKHLVQGIENIQRKQFTLYEECEFVRGLRERNLSLRDISAMIGLGRDQKKWVENRDKLNRAGEDVRDAIFTHGANLKLTAMLLVDAQKKDLALRKKLLARAIGGANLTELQQIVADAEAKQAGQEPEKITSFFNRPQAGQSALSLVGSDDYDNAGVSEQGSKIANGSFYGQASVGSGTLIPPTDNGITASRPPLDPLRNFIDPAAGFLSEAIQMLKDGSQVKRGPALRSLETLEVQVRELRKEINKLEV